MGLTCRRSVYVLPLRLGQAVANAVNGEDVAGLCRRWLDLAADVLDVGIDSPLEGLKRHAMDGVQQLDSSKDSAGLANQRQKQLELRRSQFNGVSADADPHPFNIDLEVAGFVDFLRRVTCKFAA